MLAVIARLVARPFLEQVGVDDLENYILDLVEVARHHIDGGFNTVAVLPFAVVEHLIVNLAADYFLSSIEGHFDTVAY